MSGEVVNREGSPAEIVVRIYGYVYMDAILDQKPWLVSFVDRLN